MEHYKRRGRVLTGVTLFVIAVFVGGGLQSANAASIGTDGDPVVIDAVSATKGVYRTTDGLPITVETESGDIAERTITGRTADGEPAQIIIQASALTKNDLARLKKDAAAKPDPAAGLYSTTSAGPQSGTLKPAPLDMNPKKWTVVSAVATTSTTASFAWPTVQGFDAIVDGARVGSSTDGQLTLRELRPAEDYLVELVASPVTSERATGNLEFASTRIVNISTFTGSAPTDDARLAAPLTYQPFYNQFVHKTFIPDFRVPGSQCNFFVPGWEFGGDNRSWLTPNFEEPWGPANYRTMMFVNINWDNPAPYDIGWTKNVGATQTFFNGALQNTLYADMGGMNFEQPSAGASYAQVYLRHSAGNPGCKLWDASYSGAITYGEWIQFYRSGTITADGYRFRAPAHELYGAFTNSRGEGPFWRVISRRSNEGFQCLLGNAFCPLDFYKKSAVY